MTAAHRLKEGFYTDREAVAPEKAGTLSATVAWADLTEV